MNEEIRKIIDQKLDEVKSLRKQNNFSGSQKILREIEKLIIPHIDFNKYEDIVLGGKDLNDAELEYVKFIS